MGRIRRLPRDVVWITLYELLPLQPRSRVYVQALITWLGRSTANPELARYMREGTRQLRDHLAEQLRHARQSGQVSDKVDPQRTADGLLAFIDGLSSHLLQDLHTPEAATQILTERLNELFGQFNVG